MRSRSSFTEESSTRSSCSADAELMWRLLSMTREVTVDAAAEQAVMRKPPSRRVWPIAKAPSVTAPSLKTGKGILPDCDGHRGTLNESTNVGVKTGGSRVGGPEVCVKVGW